MAYGKIKVDTLTFDNSGSDTDVTISSLNAKASLPASAGTVGASEVVQVDANKDTTGIRNLTISGNLQVNGTTTTVASSTMTVADKNIELAKGAANDAAADGGGITLESGDGNKTITWLNSTDAWTFNQNINLSLSGNGGITATAAGDHAIQIIGDANRSADQNTLLSLHGKWNGTNVAMIDIQAGADTTNKDNGQIVFYTAAAGSTAEALRIHENQAAVFTGTVSDSKGNLRSIPQKAETANYTLVAADAGKHILCNTAGITITYNPNTFDNGDAITVVNNTTGDINIHNSSGTNMQSTLGNGNRVLASRGMATILTVDDAANGTGYISGAGLS